MQDHQGNKLFIQEITITPPSCGRERQRATRQGMIWAWLRRVPKIVLVLGDHLSGVPCYFGIWWITTSRRETGGNAGTRRCRRS